MIESIAIKASVPQGPTEAEILERIAAAKETLGSRLLILGHHYQRDEVIRFADATGDSFALSRQAAEVTDAEVIVFCGVHFMAETADILTSDAQAVILPDMRAGCSMADMADIDQVLNCWDELDEALGSTDAVVPVTYMNSTAALKAFCGENRGTVCTSSNAAATFQWAMSHGEKVLFFPDQHLGRNTAFDMGIPLDDMIVWDPHQPTGGHDAEAIRRARVILWRGHCSVHQHFLPTHPTFWRKTRPGIQILVHPECNHEVVKQADKVGSTAFIINEVEAAPPGSAWAIGTEHHLVNRLKDQHPEQFITTLAPFACQCSTMSRIDPHDLMVALESFVGGEIINRITVDKETAELAKVALNRMLSIT